MNIPLTPPPLSTPLLCDDTRRKRAIFQSSHRGCKEMDLVMGQFASRHIADLSEAQLALYEDFLQEDDLKIWDWLVGRSEPENADYAPIMAMLRQYAPADL